LPPIRGFGILFSSPEQPANRRRDVNLMENVEFDDIEFIETAEELLATSYYKNIQ
jgi:hypothetical protein